MPKVSVILVLYNSQRFVEPVFSALMHQTHKDLEIVAVLNSDDGAKQLLQEKFPNVKVIEPGSNIGFAAGNNLAIHQTIGEFIQLVNPDLILEPTYIENILKAFTDPRVAAATGKLLRYDFEKMLKTNVIDSTGVTMSKSGRGRDRGQHEVDSGQYDNAREIFGVSGAGPMYRRSALEQATYNGQYFDEDFGSYWEDVDLSWRLNRKGYKNIYVPEAVAYHGRGTGSSEGGYAQAVKFIKHEQKISLSVRQLNYKNHILMYLKNTPYIHPLFIGREIVMFVYLLLFKPSALKVLPTLFRQMKTVKLKRAI